MTFAIEDRVALYKAQKHIHEKNKALSKLEILENHNRSIELEEIKLEIARKRLEDLGVNLEDV